MNKTVHIVSVGKTILWEGKLFKTPAKLVIEEQKLKVFCRLLDKDKLSYKVLTEIDDHKPRKPKLNKRPQKGIGINLKFQG